MCRYLHRFSQQLPGEAGFGDPHQEVRIKDGLGRAAWIISIESVLKINRSTRQREAGLMTYARNMKPRRAQCGLKSYP
jgi:hypothetical protein